MSTILTDNVIGVESLEYDYWNSASAKSSHIESLTEILDKYFKFTSRV